MILNIENVKIVYNIYFFTSIFIIYINSYLGRINNNNKVYMCL